MKRNYIKPETLVFKIVEKTALLSPSIVIENSDDPVTDGDDIGFAREEDSNSRPSIWENEW